MTPCPPRGSSRHERGVALAELLIAFLALSIGLLAIAIAVPGGSLAATEAPPTQLVSRPARVVGQVFHDVNRDRVRNSGERGLAKVWVALIADAERSVIASAFTGRSGGFEIEVPDSRDADGATLEVLAPAGGFPTTAKVRIAATPGRVVDAGSFGIADFQRIILRSGPASGLESGDLIEKDWSGDRAKGARRDADLVVAQVDPTEPLRVWFNHYDNNTLFTTHRSYARAAPRSLLCIAAAPLAENGSSLADRADLVAGTAGDAAGNFFVWYTQGTRGNEGYLPGRHSLGYRTLDGGDVQAVTIADFAGTGSRDIVVGTRSPAAGRGTIERWSTHGDEPGFRRIETYPADGGRPADVLGEVTAIETIGRDSGGNDVVVGTRTTAGGQLLVLGVRGAAWRPRCLETLSGWEVTSIACADFDLDGRIDLVAGVHAADGRGELRVFDCRSTGDSLALIERHRFPLPAPPLAVAAGDLGGARNPDIVVGLGDDAGDGPGGVRVLLMDGGTPASRLLDPSAGTIRGSVPALAIGDFNGGARPRSPHLDLLDIAVGVRTGASTGALVVLVR